MQKQMNKEEMEAVVCDKFLGAKNFFWDEGSLKFEYDIKSDIEMTKQYMADRIAELTKENYYLQGMLSHSNSTILNMLHFVRGSQSPRKEDFNG